METRQISNWKHRGTLYARENIAAEAIVDTTPRKIVAPTFLSGPAFGLAVNVASAKIVIAEAGDYLAVLSSSYSSATGRRIHNTVYVNTTATYVENSRDMASSDIGCVSANGILSLVATDEVSIYQYADAATVLTIHDLQLTLVRVG